LKPKTKQADLKWAAGLFGNGFSVGLQR